MYAANNSSNTVNIYQSTIAQNQASGNGGGVANGYAGTNIAIFNTIIAGNTATVTGSDAKGSFSTSSSHNLIGIVDGSNGLGNDPASREGTLASPLDAGLGVLANNGGLTWTQGLLPTSPCSALGRWPMPLAPPARRLPPTSAGRVTSACRVGRWTSGRWRVPLPTRPCASPAPRARSTRARAKC